MRRKDIRKGAFLTLLTLCVTLGLIPGADMKAYAADTYGLYVGGAQITSDNLTVSGGSGTATYDPDTHTLTLNNYSYAGNGYSSGYEGGGIDYRGGDLRIALVGSNSIVKSATSSPNNSHGIYFHGGTLTISGTGSLDISFAAASSGIGKRNGIFCEPGAFVMESGTVTTAGGTAKESAGIYTSSGITINGGTFTGIGNPTTAYESRGIYSHGGITINNGTVTAQATNDGNTAYAFHGGVTVNGGEVTASANSSGTAKAFSDSCTVAGELLEMKVGDSAESAVATTNPGDASGKKYAYIKAKGPVKYRDAAWNAETKAVDFTEKTCGDYTAVTSGLTAWGAGWFVVNSDVTISDRVSVTGEVNLILCDGKTLTASKGITVSDGNSLTIYGQTDGTGALSATGEENQAGIGGYSGDGGTITVNGGTVTANGGYYGAGIGGGSRGVGGVITVNGGEVTANGGEQGAGIGGGGGTDNVGENGCAGGVITVNGGAVTATGGYFSAGIGGGGGGGNVGGEITVNGGEVTATSVGYGAGIGGGSSGAGGTITISAGTVTATGGKNGAGIGGGYKGAGGTIAINGGTVTATGGDYSAGIGGGRNATDNGTVTIDDVLAVTAGNDATSAVTVAASAFEASHTQKYAKIEPLPVPTITAQTETLAGWTYGDTVAEENRTLSVTASAFDGGALSYQWYIVEPETRSGSTTTISFGGDDDSGGDAEPTEPAGTAIPGATGASYAVPDARPDGTPTNAGTYEFYCVVSEAGVAATATSKRVSLTVAKATPQVSVSAKELTYNGEAQELVTGSTTGGTLLYSLEEADGFVPLYDAAIPTGANAGAYQVWYYAEVDESNYNSVAPQSVSVTIAPASAPFDITLSQNSYAYDGTEKTPAVTVKKDGATVPSGEYTVAYTDNTNAGTATVTLSDVDGGNFTVSGNATFTISAASAPFDITLSQNSYAYDGTEKTPAVTVKKDGVTVPANEYTVAYTNNTNVGTATVTLTDKDGGNFTVSGNATFTISAASAPFDITLSQNSYAYDGTAKTPSVTVKKGNLTVPADEYTVAYADNTNAGTATVTLSDVSGGNYAVSGETTFTISISPVDYQDAAWNETTKTVDFTEKTCEDYTIVTSGSTAWNGGTDGAWYVVNSNVTISSRITVTGKVNLILCDGATLTASQGIQVSDGNALNIYRQSAGTGKLSASGGGAVGYQNYYGAGIGGGNRKNVGKTACGDVTIYGGTVTASGGYTSAGIGGDAGGNVTIYGGTVNATAGQYGAGIGYGDSKVGGTVTIYGGNVTAGCYSEGPGIGVGTGSMTIHGGTVTARGRGTGEGIECRAGGSVTINGGAVNAEGCYNTNDPNYAGIGSRNASGCGDIVINGGDVTAKGSANAAGIGGGNGAPGGTITVNGGTVTATGGANGAGIGGGYQGAGGTIAINGGTVTATGGENAAGIGDGKDATESGAISLSWTDKDNDSITASSYVGTVTLAKDFVIQETGAIVTAETISTANGKKIVPCELPPVASVASSETATNYVRFSDAVSAWKSAGNDATLTLLADVELNYRIDITSSRLILDLNGYGIKKSDAARAFLLIGGSLIINDSAPKRSTHKFTVDANGLAKLDENGTQSFQGGYITGANVPTNQTDNNAGGWGSVVMVGPSGSQQQESLTINGGTIIGNYGFQGAGVIRVNGICAFTMNGGAIIYNTSGYGGAVSGEGNAKFQLSGGVIANNKAGGAVRNLYLEGNNKITVSGDMDSAASIGVTMNVPGVFTSGLSGKGAASNFTSDSADYSVKLSNDGEAVLASPATLDTVPAAQSLTYNGAEQSLVTAGVATGGTVQYKVGDSGAYSETVPTATDAGTYTVYYKVFGDDIHTDTEEASAFVTIAPKEAALEWADTALTYNGAAQKPTATVLNLASGDECAVTVAGEQTDVGTHTATATALDNANYALPTAATESFTISKKTVTVSGITATNKSYDGTTEAALNYDNVVFGGVVTGDELTVTATGTFDSAEVGDGKAVKITNLTLGGADAGNYQLAETGQQTETTANITANALNVTATGYGGTYDGQSHSVTITAPDGVSVTYSESENGTYGAENPAYADAGSYTVYYKAAQVGADAVTGSATVVISKKPVTVSGITAENKSYDGNADATLNYDNVVFSGIVTGDELTVTATGTFESADVGDGKTVRITGLMLGGADAGNYQLAESGQQTETTANITANALNVTVTGYSGTYDGQSHSVTITAPDGVSVTYSESENGTYGAENPAYADAGSYTVYYKAAQVGADTVTGSATVIINKKPVTVSGITAENKSYDGNADATLNYDNVVFSGIVTGDGLTVTATGTFESADVGDGKTVRITGLTLGGADAGNYQLAETGQQTETTANITANALNVTATGYSGTYDGQTHSITVTAPDGAAVTYSESVDGEYGAVNPAYMNAGSYTVYYRVTMEGTTTVEGNASVKIAKKVVTLTWGDTAFTYDGAEKLPTATVGGLMDGDECAVTVTGGQVDVGEYTATAVSLSNDNYQLPEQNTVTFTISEASMSVTAKEYDGIYDGEAHSVTVTAPDGAAVTYSESVDGEYGAVNPAYTNAGSYTVYYRAELPGFVPVTGSESVNIEKREVSVSGITAGNKFWDGNTDATLICSGAVFDGILDGDELSVSAVGAFENAEIGYGKIVRLTNLTLGGRSAGNYRLSESGQQESTKADIMPNPLDVNAIGYHAVYDGEFHGVTVLVPDGATVSYSESEDGDYRAVSPEYTNAGSYPVFYRVEMDGAESVSGSVSVNIERREITVAGIAAENKPYDGNTNATLRYDGVTFRGILVGDELSVTATGRFESAEVGEGKKVIITDMTLGGVSADNYRLSESGQQAETAADITALRLDVSAEDWRGVYDGESHSITVSAPDGAVITYSETENGSYGAENPAYENAGEYVVYYRVTQPGAETVSGSQSVLIERRGVTVSGITAANKPYDGATEAQLSYDGVTFAGLIDGDALTVTAVGTFENAEVGRNKTVRISGLTLGGADAGNYQLARDGQQTETVADITANALNVTATGYSGTYDGQSHSIRVSAPDGAVIMYGETENGSYDTRPPAYRDAGNYRTYYRVTQPGAETVSGSQSVLIERRGVTVSGITAANKPYDGATEAQLSYDGVTFAGLIDGDALTVTAVGAFDDAEVGRDKTVKISGLTLGGADAGNYRLAPDGQQTETVADITANALSVTATGYSGAYDARSHGITVTAPEGATVTYSETRDGEYSTVNPVYKDAGNYTVYYRVSAENHDAIEGYETVSIRRASIRLTLSLVDRANPSRPKTSWAYGETPAIPLLRVELDNSAASLTGNAFRSDDKAVTPEVAALLAANHAEERNLVAVLMADGQVLNDYGLASYFCKLRNAETFSPSSAEEIAVLPAGAYTMRVDIAANRNLPAASALADFTITRAPHNDVVVDAVTVSPGAQGVRVDLERYLEEGFSCVLSGRSGEALAGDVTIDGGAVEFDTAESSGTQSGSLTLTVSSANYLDYTLTLPLITGGAFTLRFDSDGGNPVTETKRLYAGEAYGALPIPIREGYAFDGWYTSNTGGERASAESVMTVSDVTLFARWTPNEYTVTLSLDGGELPAGTEGWSDSGDTRAATFQSDKGPFALPDAVRAGYLFTGWTPEPDNGSPAKLNVSVPKGNMENLAYRANWADGARIGYATFTKDDDSASGFLGVKDLTQDANAKHTQTSGAEKSDIATALQELACDDDTTVSANQKKDVSVFMNVRALSDSEGGETERAERARIADASGETYGDDKTVKLDYLSIDIQKTVAITTTAGDGTETTDPGVPTVVTESNRVIEIPLRYDLAGRYAPVVLRVHGATAETLRRLAERPDVFDGLDGAYYVSGAGNDAVIYVYSDKFSTYAVATSGRESYAVFFDADNGTEIDSQLVYKDEGGHAERPRDPVKSGYAFKGWRDDAGGAFDFEMEVIHEDTLLHAAWEKTPDVVIPPTPVPYGGGSSVSGPRLTEYVTAEGYEGVYNGAFHSIRVSAPPGATTVYSQQKDGSYTAENPAFRDAGEYTVWYEVSGGGYPTVQDSEKVIITRREVTVSGIAAESKPYDGNANATLNYSRVKFSGLVRGDTLTVTAVGTFEDAEVGNGKTARISNLTLNGADAGNYRLAETGQQTVTRANITPNAFHVTAEGFSGVYDGARHGITVSAPEGAVVTYRESETGPYSAERPVYADAGYYLVYYRAERNDETPVTGAAAVEITRRPVTVAGIRAENKPYDGNADATLNYDGATLDGLLTGDSLTVSAEGAFEDAEIGEGKRVFINDITLRGADVANYRLAADGQQTETRADITPNMLDVNAEGYTDVYDGEAHSITVTVPEGVTVTYSEQENGTYAEMNPAYREAGTYAVYYRATGEGYLPASGSASVTLYKRPVRVSGIAAADKPYDGSADVSLNVSDAVLSGLIPGDDLRVNAIGAFENPEIGTDKTVIISTVALRGADSGNYWLPAGEQQSETRADITPNPLNVNAEGYSGVYDGQSHSISVVAPAGTEVLYAERESGAYSRANPSYRDAGTYRVYYRAVKDGFATVTGSATISIERREVTVSGITAADKEYDGNAGAMLNYDRVTFSGKLDGDTLTVSATGAFEDSEADANKTVRITGLTLGGADAGNYRLSAQGQQMTASASIIRKTYAVTGSIAHDGAESNVSLELLNESAVYASSTALMTNGNGIYSFRNVPSGSYTLVVTREEANQTVKLTMPLSVG